MKTKVKTVVKKKATAPTRKDTTLVKKYQTGGKKKTEAQMAGMKKDSYKLTYSGSAHKELTTNKKGDISSVKKSTNVGKNSVVSTGYSGNKKVAYAKDLKNKSGLLLSLLSQHVKSMDTTGYTPSKIYPKGKESFVLEEKKPSGKVIKTVVKRDDVPKVIARFKKSAAANPKTFGNKTVGSKMPESEKLMAQAKDFRKKATNTPNQNSKRDFIQSARDLEAKAKGLKTSKTATPDKGKTEKSKTTTPTTAKGNSKVVAKQSVIRSGDKYKRKTALRDGTYIETIIDPNNKKTKTKKTVSVTNPKTGSTTKKELWDSGTGFTGKRVTHAKKEGTRYIKTDTKYDGKYLSSERETLLPGGKSHYSYRRPDGSGRLMDDEKVVKEWGKDGKTIKRTTGSKKATESKPVVKKQQSAKTKTSTSAAPAKGNTEKSKTVAISPIKSTPKATESKPVVKKQQSEKPKTSTPATPAKGKTVAELWKEKTGTSWAEAKKQGLTDGSAANNMKVLKDLKSGKYDKKAPAATASPAAPEKSEPVGTLPTRKATTVDNPGTKAEREKDNRASLPAFKKGGKKVMMKYKSGGMKKSSTKKK